MNSLIQIKNFIDQHPLAQRHKFKAYSRFILWQLSQSIYPHAVKYKFIGNSTLLISKGMTGATGNIYTGLHDFSDMSFLLHFLRENDLFVDIGANVGAYTVLASAVVGSSSIAIEPVPQTFTWLERNVIINDIQTKTELINIGLGAIGGSLFFTGDLDTVNHVVLDTENTNGSLIEVKINTLDNILSTRKIPALIKIDVEGFEQEVINGGVCVFQNPALKSVIIELNGSGARYGYDEEKIHRQLLGYGFFPYLYEPFKRKLTAENSFGKYNTIYIRDLEFVLARLSNARKIKVFSEAI